MFPLWLLGCIISLAGSVGAIVGTTIQKLSFRHNDGQNEHTHTRSWDGPQHAVQLSLRCLLAVNQLARQTPQ